MNTVPSQSWLDRDRVFVIAELANAHEGSFDEARLMIAAAADAGADAVKFQRFYNDEMLAPGHPMMDHFADLCWTDEEWHALIAYVAERGMLALVDVFGLRAYEFVLELSPIAGLKIHGADIGNEPLLDRLANDERPILIGTGGSSDLDVYRALVRLGRPERIVLMHGFQGFPTPLEDTALARITHMQTTFGLAVGLSEHIDADDPMARIAPLMALPLGIRIIEKHLTLDRKKKGVDYQSSLEPAELTAFIRDIRLAEIAVGSASMPRSATEVGYRRRFKKSLIASRDIAVGEALDDTRFEYRMTVAPDRFTLSTEDATGAIAKRAINAGAILSSADIGAKTGICLISRLKSTRLKNKAYVDIHGASAIERLISRAKLSTADTVVMATSSLAADEPLIATARAAGIQAYGGDPDEPLERLIHCAEAYGWRFVARVTGDTPLFDPGLFDRAASLAAEHNLDYVSMWNAPIGTHSEIFSLSALNVVRRHARADFTTEYLSWFFYGNTNFKTAEIELDDDETRNWRLTLDTAEDLECIRRAVQLVGPGNHTFTVKDLIRAVESDTELVERITAQPYRPHPPTQLRFDFSFRQEASGEAPKMDS